MREASIKGKRHSNTIPELNLPKVSEHVPSFPSGKGYAAKNFQIVYGHL